MQSVRFNSPAVSIFALVGVLVACDGTHPSTVSYGTAGGSAGSSGTAGGIGLDPPTPETVYFGDGSRLRAGRLRLGGVDVVDYWYDRDLQVSCEFATAEDGVRRCLPHDYGDVLYTNEECTEPVFQRRSSSCRPAGFAFALSVFPVGSCRERRRVFEVAEEILRPPVLYRLRDYICMPVETIDTYAPFHALRWLSPEQFVAERLAPRERAAGLLASTSEREDGSWQIVGLHDPGRGVRCDPLEIEAGGEYCVPAPIWFGFSYADDGCTVRAAVEPPCHDEQASSIRFQPVAGPWEIYEPGAPITMESFNIVNGACEALGYEVTLRPVGPAIELSTLPRLQRHLAGTGRAKVTFLGFGDIPYFPVPSWPFSDQVGNRCRMTPFAGGKTYCTPCSWVYRDPSAHVAFADPTCSEQPLLPHVPNVVNNCLAPDELPEGHLLWASNCHAQSAVSRTVPAVAHEGVVYARQSADICEAHERVAGELFYLLSTVADPSVVFPPVEVIPPVITP